jgi:phosphoribosylformylglycinamidine cyclo-ligase
VAEVLLTPHRSYLAPLESSLSAGRVRALAHITGGGIPGNLDRVLPADLDAVVRTAAWTPPVEFRVLGRESGAPGDELFRVFNMGIGMIAVVPPGEVERVASEVSAAGCETFVLGELVPGSGGVRLE